YTTTQTTATWYHCVVTCTASGQSANSTNLKVELTSYLTCYCTPNSYPYYYYSYYCSYYINHVSISGTSLDNYIVCNIPYINYPASGNTTDSMISGNSYSMTLAGTTSMYYSVWIDFNHDGIFGSTEQIVTTYLYSSTVGFTVPVTALSGQTRMRVRA